MLETPLSSRRQLLTIRQVAARLNVSVRTVWRLIQAGKLRVRRIGNSTRIEIGQIDEFLDGC